MIYISDPEEKTVLHSGGEMLPDCRGEELPLLQIQEMSPVREYLKSRRLTIRLLVCRAGMKPENVLSDEGIRERFKYSRIQPHDGADPGRTIQTAVLIIERTFPGTE